MNRPCLSQRSRPIASTAAICCKMNDFRRRSFLCGVVLMLAAAPASAQITIDTRNGEVVNKTTTKAGTVDRRYAQIEPTHVPLTQSELDARTRSDIIRVMQSEQGFAMRPFPRGHKGLT